MEWPRWAVAVLRGRDEEKEAIGSARAEPGSDLLDVDLNACSYRLVRQMHGRAPSLESLVVAFARSPGTLDPLLTSSHGMRLVLQKGYGAMPVPLDPYLWFCTVDGPSAEAALRSFDDAVDNLGNGFRSVFLYRAIDERALWVAGAFFPFAPGGAVVQDGLTAADKVLIGFEETFGGPVELAGWISRRV